MSSRDGREDTLRSIPSVDLAMRHIESCGLADVAPRPIVVRRVRRALDEIRLALTEAPDGDGGDGAEAAVAMSSLQTSPPEDARDTILNVVAESVRALAQADLRPVINATGILIHTNLGRSPLAVEAIEAAAAVAGAYSNLEFDLASGGRGHRDELVRDALCELTGAEDALVVNNNAAAVLLALNTLASGRDVIVSRGELIEIGGSFRLPEVFGRSGVRMVEVGTTNRTRIEDFERAYTSRTAALMKAHWSNYSIEGFVARVSAGELATLGARYGIPVINDLGSGALLDTGQLGLPHEETVAESVASGVAVSTFSGDKLVGGPQCGMAVGTASAIGRMRANPLMRALRPGKLTLAALGATLRLFLEERERERIPVLAMAGATAESVGRRAQGFVERARGRLPEGASLEVVDSISLMGGGTAPEAGIESHAVRVSSDSVSATWIATRLRAAKRPVIARVADDAVLLDLRTVQEDDEGAVLDALEAALNDGGQHGD